VADSLDIFVSYTSSDRDWAFWIGQELERLGHVVRIHEWEIPAGGDIPKWMEERLQETDRVLCVVSQEYLTKDYSGWERRSAQWAAASKRPNFMLPVFVADCEAPVAMAHIKRCDLYGLSEDDARSRLEAYLAEPGRVAPARFPGKARRAQTPLARPETTSFPGGKLALSNIPIRVPEHFLGRAEAIEAIDAALKRGERRVAITALHGLRGVGKTTLAAAYAERRRADYRATWWIRAQTEATMRADLVALGVRLGWVAADEKEDPALAAVRERLRDEGDGLLLIYDNAIDAASLRSYLPVGGAARVIVTSNAHAWRGIAAPVEIHVWPKQVGADFLSARTGRERERADAEALSEALGGLPLAHEQAAAYCERLDKSLAEYRRLFEGAPARLLDADKDAPAEYYDRRTVAKTFALAIDEAAKLHPAAEPLIVRAAMLAPEPIPLYLFSEGREAFGEPLASQLADEGLDEAIAALRSFALVDREGIADERDPAITTETIRLHRLVRTVAAGRLKGEAVEAARRSLVEAMAAVYPSEVYKDLSAWPRARRLDALALDLISGPDPLATGAETASAYLLNGLGQYRHGALAAYQEARPLLERALAICETALGPEDPSTGASLNNLALLLQEHGDLAGALPLYERALAICEKAFGPEHPYSAGSLSNLARLLQDHGDLAGALPLYERALAICEKAFGPEHPYTATSLDNLAGLLRAQGDLAGALPLFERALAISEKALEPEHPSTARSLNDLANLLQAQGDLAGARRLLERALAIYVKALGPEHPSTATSLHNLAGVLTTRAISPTRGRFLSGRWQSARWRLAASIP
jgi:tetratricopeptide (TPR) repeat protein